MKAINLHSIVPVRAEAAEESEQLTQLLFGEPCEIVDECARWKKVRSDLDGQEGWVDWKMISPMSDEEYAAYSQDWQAAQAKVLFPMAYAMSENNGQTIPLSAGTRLPKYADGRFEVLGVTFRIQPDMVAGKPLEMNAENVMKVTRFMLNIPYLWGGKNAMGIDCSGFTQTVHALFGHNLLRNAREQITQGTVVERLSEAKAGDLVFFDHYDGRVSHVGLLLDAERVMHSSGRVKVEMIDDEGIISQEPSAAEDTHAIKMADGRYHTHHLVGIRRY